MASPLFDLTGKVALITGGNRGIGLGMAKALGQAGANLVIWGRDAQRNVAAAKELASLQVRVVTREVDVADESAVIEGMADAVARLGRIDSVFANAGTGGRFERFANATTENLRATFSVNIDGAFWTFREACKSIMERAKAGDPGGSLVAISSLGSLYAMPRAEAYAMSKAALPALMRSIAVEYARYGVRANTVLPGWVHTDMTDYLRQDSGFQDRILPRIPLKRWATPADYGGIAVYLASDASAYHTADCFLIDGGYASF
jgi:NAD(P)-dependent dehydrogenase (short-subunit alcohol dehydrogenase family)